MNNRNANGKKRDETESKCEVSGKLNSPPGGPIDEISWSEIILDELVLVPDGNGNQSCNALSDRIVDAHLDCGNTGSLDTAIQDKSLIQPDTVLTHSIVKSGTIFIEGQLLRDHPYTTDIKLRLVFYEKLVKLFSSDELEFSFTVGADLLANDDGDNLAQYVFSEEFYQELKQTLSSLKVVEYLGPASQSLAHHSHNVRVRVDVYGLCVGDTVENFQKDQNGPDGEENVMRQTQTSPMPNVAFDGIWDRLAFDENIKEDLIWMMANLIRFSKLRGSEPPDINPLILLYGPPGTGKTSLCQGISQKISIRHSSRYKSTLLVQVKTSTLLSKYFSESAKKVDEIFSSVDYLCKQDTGRFICVLIDEVESIATCREIITENGEAQDSLRATNTMLTGLDRVRVHANLIILCTSNMLDNLDAAFLDRCGLKLGVDIPSRAAQYAILKGRLEGLMARGVIKPKLAIPPFEIAELNSYDLTLSENLPGARLLKIVTAINDGEFSGRSLTQLPEISIMRYLRDEDCDLLMAFGFMNRYIISQQQQCRKRKRADDEVSVEKETATIKEGQKES
ncbi:cell division control protein 48 [Phlyctema vagabunda]|uniref:Cell division control protein 48 n=1 Tax=Phlyctema vagabunda TaxID=108571 RepID=A0ABR4P3D8_9HELO